MHLMHLAATALACAGSTEAESASHHSEERAWHLRVGVDAVPIVINDQSLDALAVADIVLAGALAVEGEWRLMANLPLVAQLQYAGSMFGSTLLQNLRTSTVLHSALLSFQGGYRLFNIFTPYARAGLSCTWIGVDIGLERQRVGGWAFSPGLFALVGAELGLSRPFLRKYWGRDLFSAAVRVEGGYWNLGHFSFAAQAISQQGGPTVHTPQLGALRLAGATARLGLFLSY